MLESNVRGFSVHANWCGWTCVCIGVGCVCAHWEHTLSLSTSWTCASGIELWQAAPLSS